MNQGSTVELALAVADAGAFPSLCIPIAHDDIDYYDKIIHILTSFIHSNNSANVILAISLHQLKDPKLLKIVRDYKISHIEIFPSDPATGTLSDFSVTYNDPFVLAGIRYLRNTAKVITRIYSPTESTLTNNFDGLFVKGKESGGRTGEWSVKELWQTQTNMSSECPSFPYGGIGTPTHVKAYIQAGAQAVGVGTLFAACLESPLSNEVKQKMIAITAQDITVLPDTQQNSIVFGQGSSNNSADWNHSCSLADGIHGNGTQGLLYVGHGITDIDRIRTVKETVEYLISDL